MTTTDQMDAPDGEPARRFEGLRQGLQGPRQELASMRRRNAPELNVFRFLGIHKREVKTHSAMLAGLLNPMGFHGQGDLFLREFLNSDFLPPAIRSLPTENWEVHCELPVLSPLPPSEEPGAEEQYQKGRVDVILRHPPSGTIIVIENKIYAKDQDRQLERYQSWLDDQRALWPQQALLYLNLDGHTAPSTDAPWFRCITYKHDILPILGRKIEEPRVDMLVKEYINLIPTLSGGPYMDSPADPMIEYLAKPENLRCLLEVAPKLNDVKNHVRRGFMRELENRIREKLPTVSRENWRAVGKHVGDQWLGVCVLPPGPADPRYVFRIELDRDLFHGIWAWGEPSCFNEEERSNRSFIEAKAELLGRRFDTVGRAHSWIGCTYSERGTITEDAALLQLLERREEMLETATRKALEDFESFLAPLILTLESNRMNRLG